MNRLGYGNVSSWIISPEGMNIAINGHILGERGKGRPILNYVQERSETCGALWCRSMRLRSWQIRPDRKENHYRRLIICQHVAILISEQCYFSLCI